MECANLIVNIFVAIGTVGAVVYSLYLSNENNKIKVNKMISTTTENNKKILTINIYNIDISRPLLIKELGFANKIKNKWINVKRDSYKCLKRSYLERNSKGRFIISDLVLTDPIMYGEEIAILLDKNIEKELLKQRHPKIAVILITEQKIWIRVTKKRLKELGVI
ncbi:MAG: hypothetical protein PHD02_04555 [Bacilli bacterium]|nr:hypothetical protein [Bacilli bacterium]